MSATRVIRIDAIGQNNFDLRFVGMSKNTRFHVNPGDNISFVAYYNNNKIDYQIVFKSQTRSPFTDVHRIDMPQGGVSDPLTVTTLLLGGMPFQIRIPSLGWEVDPEIVVEGATILGAGHRLRELLEQLLMEMSSATLKTSVDYVITVKVSGSTFTFSGIDPLLVNPGDTIAWEISQDGENQPNFVITFSANPAPVSPLVQYENLLGPSYYNGTTAEVASRLFRPLDSGEGRSKNFTYTIAMLTGSAPTSSPRTITLNK